MEYKCGGCKVVVLRPEADEDLKILKGFSVLLTAMCAGELSLKDATDKTTAKNN